jgi:hypothetical protein
MKAQASFQYQTIIGNAILVAIAIAHFVPLLSRHLGQNPLGAHYDH